MSTREAPISAARESIEILLQRLRGERRYPAAEQFIIERKAIHPCDRGRNTSGNLPACKQGDGKLKL